jgi:hypothetical protein
VDGQQSGIASGAQPRVEADGTPVACSPEPGAASRGRAQAILEAAEALLGEQGYEAATLKAIGEQAGIPTASVYHYFSDRHRVDAEFCGVICTNSTNASQLLRTAPRCGSCATPSMPPSTRYSTTFASTRAWYSCGPKGAARR